MGFDKLSVDDILEELKLKKDTCPKDTVVADMADIDELVKDILTKRKASELDEEKRALSDEERMELEEEIRAQTAALTSQFEKIILDNATASEDKALHNDNLSAHVKLGEKTVKSSQLAGHFGNVGMDDAIKEKSSRKLAMDVNKYKEYKASRNKRIDGFVLNSPAKANEAVEQINPQELLDSVSVPKRQMPYEDDEFSLESEKFAQDIKSFGEDILNEDFEYTNPSQKQEVLDIISATKKSVLIPAISLLVLFIISIPLLFASVKGQSFLLFGKVNLTVGIFSLVNIGLTLIALVVSFSIITNALKSIVEHKPDKDILYTIVMIISFLQTAIVCLKPEKLLVNGVHLYTPVLIVILLANFIGKFVSIKRIEKNFAFISSDTQRYAITSLDDLNSVKNVKTDFFQNFLYHSFLPDISDKLAMKLAVAAIPIVAVMFIMSFILTKNAYIGISFASASLLILTGVVGAILVSVPLYGTARVMEEFEDMIPEYDAIEAYKDTDSVLIEGSSLFSQKSVVLHGIRTYQGKRLDNAIVDAASVLQEANSVLKHVFLFMLEGKNVKLKPVDSIVYEDSMGISAWVDGKRVLIGNRQLMINHSIAVPKEELSDLKASFKTVKRSKSTIKKPIWNDVVYLSSEGELCAVFTVTFNKDDTVQEIIDLMSRYKISGLVKTVDSFITSEMLSHLYGIDESAFNVLSSALNRGIENETKPADNTHSVLGNSGSFFSVIVLLTVCKKVFECVKFGQLFYILSVACGLLFLLMMLFLKIFTFAGALPVFILVVVFGLLYYIYEKNLKF